MDASPDTALPASDSGASTDVADGARTTTADAFDTAPDRVDGEASIDVAPDVPLVTDAAIDTAAKPTAGLVAYYGFDEPTGSTVADLSGNKRAATLSGQYSHSPGVESYGVSLGPSGVDGGAGYVALPDGLLASAKAMTIATWVRLNTNLPWQRIFDFGVSTGGPYMFLTVNTPSTDGAIRFQVKIKSDAGVLQPVIDGPSLPVGQWKHVAVVLDGKGGRLYVDGLLTASNTQIPTRPSDLGDTVNNWIGRSEYDRDPPFDGQVDEFRVYDRALSAAEIATLAIP